MPEPEGPATRFTPSEDGVPIAYTSRGAGNPALVLIHGWSCDKSYWAAQIEPLSGEFQLIAADLGGHGESGTGRKSWTIGSFAQDVAAVVEAVDPGPVVLVGHSMGGTVAVAAARLLGKRVANSSWWTPTASSAPRAHPRRYRNCWRRSGRTSAPGPIPMCGACSGRERTRSWCNG